MYFEKIVNVVNGEEILREYSETEIQELEENQLAAIKDAEKAEIKLAAKLAVLDRLGITEEEAKLLLS